MRKANEGQWGAILRMDYTATIMMMTIMTITITMRANAILTFSVNPSPPPLQV